MLTFMMTWKPTGRFIRYEVPRAWVAELKAELAAYLATQGDGALPEYRLLKARLDKEGLEQGEADETLR